MDDLSEKLAQILNDPESMNGVRQMAQALLSKQESPPANENLSLPDNPFDEQQMMQVLSIVNQLKARKDDNRTALLLALKPHLSEPRQEKINTAVKLLKLIDLLPVLKQSGLLNF